MGKVPIKSSNVHSASRMRVFRVTAAGVLAPPGKGWLS